MSDVDRLAPERGSNQRGRSRWLALAVAAIALIVVGKFVMNGGEVRRDSARQAWDFHALHRVHSSCFTADFDGDGLQDLLTADIANWDAIDFEKPDEVQAMVRNQVLLLSSRTGEVLESWMSEPGGVQFGILGAAEWACVHSNEGEQEFGWGTCLLEQCEFESDGLKARHPFQVGKQSYSLARDFEEDPRSPVWTIHRGEELVFEWSQLPGVTGGRRREHSLFAPMQFVERGFLYELEWARGHDGPVELTEHRFAETSSSRSVQFDGYDLVTSGMRFQNVVWYGFVEGAPALLLHFSLAGDHAWVEYSPFEEGWSREVARIHEVELQAFAAESIPLVNRIGDRFIFSHVSIQEGEDFPIQLRTQVEGLEPRFETLGTQLGSDGIESAYEPLESNKSRAERLGITHQVAKVVPDQNGDGLEDLLVSYEVNGPKRARVGVILLSGATGEVLPRL